MLKWAEVSHIKLIAKLGDNGVERGGGVASENDVINI
jgi:hypothetical protein